MQLHNAAAALLNPEKQGLSENIGAGLGHLLSALFFQMSFFFFYVPASFLFIFFFLFFLLDFPFFSGLGKKAWLQYSSIPRLVLGRRVSLPIYVITVLWLSLALEVLMQIKWKTLQQERYSYLHCPMHGPNR